MNPPRKSQQSRSPQQKEPAGMSLDYDHLLRLCLKYWVYLTAAVVVGFVGGYLYALSQTAIYETYSTIVVNGQESSVPTVGSQVDTQSPDVLKTLEQMLQTKDLPERVVQSEHLNENAEFLGPKLTPPVSEEAATSILADDVSIHVRPLTHLIDITVDHPSAKMAKFLADKLAEQSLLQRVQVHASGATVLSTYFQQEVDRLKDKVKISRQALHDYEVAHKADGIAEGDKTDLSSSRLQDLNAQYMKAIADETMLAERYGENHPKLIQAKKLVELLHNEVMTAQDVTLGAGATSIGYDQLKTEAASYENQLTSMLKALNDADVAQNVANPGIAVWGEAGLPGAPKYPSKTKSAAVGAFIGLVCGLGFVFGVYFIDATIRSVGQAESTFAVPVIAAIPILAEGEGHSVLPTYSDPQSFVAESFRGLRASLLLHDRENPIKTVLVASAVPGEGKSFCAANLAVAFAQAGLKTLLIDGDLRLPTLHTYFNVPGTDGVAGFANFLTGKQTLVQAAIKSPIPTLELLLTINPAESPAEMLSSPRLPVLLEEVASKYDRVVIDSAPLTAVSDTMLIMPMADAILLVIRATSTPSSETKLALQRIYSGKMKPLGLILNYLAPHTLKSYAYGYSYGQKPKEKNAK